MGADSAIAWTHATFNPWIGCSRVSEGCTNCYAEKLAHARFEGPPGRKLPLWGVDAARRPMADDYWKAPARWNRQAHAARERRRVFCASLADVAEFVPARNVAAADVMTEGRKRLRDVIQSTHWLDWLLLTKRPENLPRAFPQWCANGFPSNVWLGVTAEDQRRADERIPLLLALPAAVHFVSHEPALSHVDFSRYLRPAAEGRNVVRWIITGGESGHGARRYDLTWARSVVSQCRDVGAAPFVKQLGSNSDFNVKHPKGEDPEEWPTDLRIREFPRVS